MKKPDDINKKLNETLDSLDGIQRAEPQPFFYARLIGRLQREEKNIWETTGSFLARPAVAIAGLCLILAINVFILFQKDASTVTPTYSESVQPQDEESAFAAAHTYDYENLEP